MKPFLRSVLGGILLLFWPIIGQCHVPVPPGVLDPKTPAEAWNVVRLSTANVERLLTEGRLSEITDQISLCSPALRALPQWAAHPVTAQSLCAGVAVSSLAQAALAGDRALTEQTLGTLRGILTEMATAYDPKTVGADIFFCPMHPDFVSPDARTPCTKCGMNLLRRRIPYSFVYVPPGEPTIQLTALAAETPVPGHAISATVRLAWRDGSPVSSSDLLVMHTQPIHLLIVDPALADYHHEHPVPTGTPGEYTFSFTPARATPYRIFADVTPTANGVQEYPRTDLPASGSPDPIPIHRAGSSVCTVDGLTFHLRMPAADGAPPRAGHTRNLQIAVSDAAGKPFLGLEPVMGAFAHLVGFYDDYRTVVHLHPEGGEISDPQARGGSEMDFVFYPPRGGLMRLYCQVQVGGGAVSVPFDVNIAP